MVDELDRLISAIRMQPGIESPANWVASLSPDEQVQFLASLSDDDLHRLEYVWPFWARSEQLPPPSDWRFWLFRGGPRRGKTRARGEGIRAAIEDGQYRRIALVAPTMTAGRQVMIEGESGLLAVCSPWFRPAYEPSRHRLRWPNGATATLYSADAPERFRGPQHDAFWAD